MPDHPDPPPGFAALAAAAARDPQGGDALIALARAALREDRRDQGLRALAGLVSARQDAGTVRGFLAGMRLLDHCLGDPRFDLESPVLGLRASEDGTRLEVGLREARQVYDPITWWSHLEPGPLPGHEPDPPRQSALVLVDVRARPEVGSRRVVDCGEVRVVAEERRLRVVTRDKGRPLQQSVGTRCEIKGLVGSPDGRLALTVDADGEVVCWDTETGLPRWRREAEALLPRARRRPRPAFAADGRLLVWAPSGGAWVDPDTGAATPLPDPLEGAPWRAAAPGPEGAGWAAAAEHTVVHVAEDGRGRPATTPAPDALGFLPGGELLVCVSGGQVRVLDLAHLEEVHAARLPESRAARYAPRILWRGGRLLVRVPTHGTWEFTGAPGPRLRDLGRRWARRLSAFDLAFTADGRHLLVPRGHHLRLEPHDE